MICDPAGPFTELLWGEAGDIVGAIGRHPFVSGLADGTLDPAVFARFLVQDGIYLENFARCLLLLADSALDPDAGAALTELATTTVAEELALQERLGEDQRLAKHVGVLPRRAGPTPTGYASFLLARVGTESHLVGLTSLLPCMWIYAEIGGRIAGGAERAVFHPLRDWASEYAAPEFRASAENFIGLVERTATLSTPAELERSRRVFAIAAAFELQFFDAAYRGEDWIGL